MRFNDIYLYIIKNNKNIVFVEDYKYDDYRLVESFKKADYLDDYIKIDNEDRVYVEDDLVLIKRV